MKESRVTWVSGHRASAADRQAQEPRQQGERWSKKCQARRAVEFLCIASAPWLGLQKKNGITPSFPGTVALLPAAAHTYTPHHHTPLCLLILFLMSLCRLSIVTYHTGRLEGSGGQEGLGHGQAQERNQERKGPHGCRLPVILGMWRGRVREG